MAEMRESEQARFREAALSQHNAIRKSHGVGPLRRCGRLDRLAQAWAESMARRKALTHSAQEDRTLLGENVFWSPSYKGPEEEVRQALKAFYAESKVYSYQRGGDEAPDGQPVNHFTQLVWRRCFHMGAGIALAKDGSVYTCFNYDPPGNWEGGFAENVFPKGAAPPAAPDAVAVPDLVLARHNALRARHGAAPLVLNPILTIAALQYAQEMAASQDFSYRPGYRFGVNIALVSELSPVSGVDVWYRQGGGLASFPGGLQPALSNFAQLVWKGTTRLGVGLAVGRPWTVLVVLYDPKGAQPELFQRNVQPALDPKAPLPP